jgi:hypothetical protein
MNVDEIQIQLIPNVLKCCDHFRVGLAPAVSLKKFSETSKFIGGNDNNFMPLCINWALGEKIVDLTAAEISRLSENALSWALSQNLEEGLKRYRNLPTVWAVEIPVRHLAALALAGEVARLGYYQRCFDQGDRQDFGLSISVEMIERAISIAQKIKDKKEKVQIFCGDFLDPTLRRVTPVERRSAQTKDEFSFGCGQERLVMTYHTGYWPLRM